MQMYNIVNIDVLLHLLRQSKNKKMKGVSSYVYALVMMLLLSCCMYLSFRYISVRDQAKGIENSIATSLLGASRGNIAEFGTTNQIAIHELLPAKYKDTLAKIVNPAIPEMYIPNNINYFPYNPAYAPEFAETYYDRDLYLDNSKNKFSELLQYNLDLDENMVPYDYSDFGNGKILQSKYYNEASGTYETNRVNVDEYTIINKYSYRDAAAPFNRHTYTVVYRSLNGGAFTIVTALSGIDKVTRIGYGVPGWEGVIQGGKCDGITVESTSVYARISFYTNLGIDISGKKHSKQQIVDRVVTIREK